MGSTKLQILSLQKLCTEGYQSLDIYKSGVVRVIDKLNIMFPYSMRQPNHQFNEQIIQSIQNHIAIAAMDALVKVNTMEGIWIITSRAKEFEVKYIVYVKDQKDNTLKAAEAVLLLDLVKTIVPKIERMDKGTIIILIIIKRFVE